MSPTLQRVVGVLVLVAVGMMSLPAAAFILDDPGVENWIIPAQMFVMAVTGAGVTLALPSLAQASAPAGRRALTGACWGLLAALIGVLIFWLLISGLVGA